MCGVNQSRIRRWLYNIVKFIVLRSYSVCENNFFLAQIQIVHYINVDIKTAILMHHLLVSNFCTFRIAPMSTIYIFFLCILMTDIRIIIFKWSGYIGCVLVLEMVSSIQFDRNTRAHPILMTPWAVLKTGQNYKSFKCKCNIDYIDLLLWNSYIFNKKLII